MPGDHNIPSSPSGSPTPLPVTLDQVSGEWLTARLKDIEDIVKKDVIVIMGVIAPQLDIVVRMALEHLKERNKSSLVILDTPGGFVETTERIAHTLRQDRRLSHPERGDVCRNGSRAVRRCHLDGLFLPSGSH